MEDGIVLARSFAEASKNGEVEEEFKKIEMGLKRFAQERKRSSFELLEAQVMGLVLCIRVIGR